MANIDKKIEKAIKPITKMYSELETELLIKIAEHFKINEEFINSDYWRIAKLNEMGAFNSEVIDFIAKYTNRSREEIKKALENVFKDTLDLDTLRSAYKNNQIKINPKEILNSPVMMSIMDNAYNEMSKRFIQMSNMIESATRRAYLDIIEKTYLATSTGIESYSESIRKSLNELANRGIDTLDYVYEKDGVQSIRHYDVEGTARREILTGARQLSGYINIELVKETGCEYVKFSEHLDCRPTHFDWQGTIVKASEWETIADYGDVAGIYGINCRHYVEPYFGDHTGNEEKRLTQEECNEAYKISQKQRYLERGVRAWKRRKEMSKASEDIDMYKKSNMKVKEWSKRLDEFTKENDRRRDYTREYISLDNINESERKGNNKEGKVNWNIVNSEHYSDKINITRNKKVNDQIYNISQKILSHRDNTLKEDMYLINSKDGNILAYQTNMKTDLHISYNPQMRKAIEKNSDIITIHNHPLSMPPSIDDINSAFEKKYKLGVVIAHDGAIYTYNIKKMKTKIVQREYDVAVEKYTKMYYNDSKRGQLEALAQLSKLYNFEIKEVI